MLSQQNGKKWGRGRHFHFYGSIPSDTFFSHTNSTTNRASKSMTTILIWKYTIYTPTTSSTMIEQHFQTLNHATNKGTTTAEIFKFKMAHELGGMTRHTMSAQSGSLLMPVRRMLVVIKPAGYGGWCCFTKLEDDGILQMIPVVWLLATWTLLIKIGCYVAKCRPHPPFTPFALATPNF